MERKTLWGKVVCSEETIEAGNGIWTTLSIHPKRGQEFNHRRPVEMKIKGRHPLAGKKVRVTYAQRDGRNQIECYDAYSIWGGFHRGISDDYPFFP